MCGSLNRDKSLWPVYTYILLLYRPDLIYGWLAIPKKVQFPLKNTKYKFPFLKHIIAMRKFTLQPLFFFYIDVLSLCGSVTLVQWSRNRGTLRGDEGALASLILSIGEGGPAPQIIIVSSYRQYHRSMPKIALQFTSFTWVLSIYMYLKIVPLYTIQMWTMLQLLVSFLVNWQILAIAPPSQYKIGSYTPLYLY